jgi:hypothetical protein
VVENIRGYVSSVFAIESGPVDAIPGSNAFDRSDAAVRHQDWRVTLKAVGARMRASAKSVDRPVEPEAVVRDVVDDAFCPYLVERDPAKLGGVEAPHHRLVGKQRELGSLLGFLLD